MAKYVKTEQGYIDASIFAPAQFKPEGKSYLTFSSPKNFTLEVNNRTKNWDGILEYFAYDKTWTVWDGTTILSAYNNDGEYVLYLRGTGNTKITGNGINKEWIITGTDVKCIGNIENLLDYITVEAGNHPTMTTSCYSYMFKHCTSITQAPDLPATTLSSHCYEGMFLDCYSLTKAPKLPATTLSDYCYREMFSGCTRLTQAPALPATTLASYCYFLMFFNCSSFTQAPALPAIKLASNCYDSMFHYCTSLTQAPALPATTLSDYCYQYMFCGCTSLTKAPKLPATTLASYCYDGMFRGCIRLTKAPKLPATTLSVCCYRGMFYGCTSLTQAPALPATTLSDYCYPTMFSGCISLIQTPALPAIKLASHCYDSMFERCTALKLSSTKTVEYAQEYRIPTTGTGTTATDALTNMFVSTGGTFTGTPAINTTYYLSTDNMIVRDTEVATLNGYVGSMIDNSVSNPLNITGATVGQIAKITAVDESGKPTSWEAVDMPSGSDEWELIAHINVADDVEKDVTVWEYNNLPRYKYIAYKKVNLVGSGDQTASGCTIQINNESSQPSGMTYGKSGSPQNCIGMIYVMPFGWTHYKTIDATSPNNISLGGFNAMLTALPLSDNAITSIKLSAHTIYKIASGEIWLYGKKG